ncbi:MAG: nucleoside deaminase [Desulfonatronovibrio sp.]
MSEKANQRFMAQAIALSAKNLELLHGGPFGAVVVKDNQIIGQGYNQVIQANDPTAHAEIVAIRQACAELGSFSLEDCSVYSSCEPCPMCLGAIYWARPDNLYYACTRHDAGLIGFDDYLFYQELEKPQDQRIINTFQIMRDQAYEVFQSWQKKAWKPAY